MNVPSPRFYLGLLALCALAWVAAGAAVPGDPTTAAAAPAQPTPLAGEPTPQARALAAAAFPNGKLTWAADTTGNAPFSFDDPSRPGQLTGFEYDIITAIAARLGVEAELRKGSWDGLIPGLQAGDKYDCVICGIEVTAARAREVAFTSPYYFGFEQLVTRAGTPPIHSLAELRGKKVGTLSQTGAMVLLQQTPGIEVLTYDQELNAYNDCAQGRIFAVLLDYPIAMYYAKPNPNLEFNGPPFGHLSYAIAVRQGNEPVLDALNYGLQQVIASGELHAILSKWNLWSAVTAQDLGQPVVPAGPPTAYQAFIRRATQPPTLGERLERFWLWRNTLAHAALNTLLLSMISMVLAVGLGFALAVLRVFAPRPLQLLAVVYIEVVRGTPLLIQMLFIYFGLPNIGLKLTPWEAGILGLGLNYAAYEAENYRAGLLAVPRGQMEAACALGMTRRQGLRFVVIPQAFRLVLPPVTNDFISLLKDSSLVTMISIMDLTNVYQRMATTYYDYFGTGLVIACIYLLIGLPFVRLARWTEERLAVDKRPPNQRPGLVPAKVAGGKPNLSEAI